MEKGEEQTPQQARHGPCLLPFRLVRPYVTVIGVFGLLTGPTVPSFVIPQSILHSSNDQGDLFHPSNTTVPLFSFFFLSCHFY